MTVSLIFYGDYTKSGVATAPSVAPTFTLYRINRSTGVEDSTPVVNAQATTASALTGRYFYQVTGLDLTTYDYHGRFHTTDTTVDAADVPVLWTQFSLPSVPQTGDAFIVASSGVNIKAVNGHPVTGSGTGSDPWRPA